MEVYSVAMSEPICDSLIAHLIREDGQEDLCFALYTPSTGASRLTGLVVEVVLPIEGDRNVHGNASFNPEYLDRVTELALQSGLGIIFMHSHPFPGWQHMSKPDIEAETMLAPRIMAATGLPLIGMTVGNDSTWSARFWIKSKPKTYNRYWCKSVRIVGEKLDVQLADIVSPPLVQIEGFTRTVSAWGEKRQAEIERLKIGVVGLGSVGSIVCEALLRIGVQELVLIDYDSLESRNIDRQHSMKADDIGRLKVEAYAEYLHACAPRPDVFSVEVVPFGIQHEAGLTAALDCDVLFSCVDRPLPRYVLDTISYANLIPVIDGGIDASINTNGDNIGQARWRAFVIGPGRRCLRCCQQYNDADVAMEIEGLLEDQSYISNLPSDHFINRGENVYAFSLALSGMLMTQFLSLLLQPQGQSFANMGGREMDLTTGMTSIVFPTCFESNCDFARYLHKGDEVNKSLSTRDSIRRGTARKLKY